MAKRAIQLGNVQNVGDTPLYSNAIIAGNTIYLAGRAEALKRIDDALALARG